MPAIKAKPYSLTPVVATGKKRVKAQRDEIVATPVYDLPCDLSLCASWSVTTRSCLTRRSHFLGAVEYPMDGQARAAFRTQDGKASSSSF